MEKLVETISTIFTVLIPGVFAKMWENILEKFGMPEVEVDIDETTVYWVLGALGLVIGAFVLKFWKNIGYILMMDLLMAGLYCFMMASPDDLPDLYSIPLPLLVLAAIFCLTGFYIYLKIRRYLNGRNQPTEEMKTHRYDQPGAFWKTK